MYRLMLSLFGVGLLLTTGCATPRVINQSPGEVTVAVPDNSNVWPSYYQDEAKKVAAKSLNNPQLVGVKQVKVGETLTTQNNQTRQDIQTGDQRRVGEVRQTSGSSTINDNFEYHLIFKSMEVKTGTNPGFTPLGQTPPVIDQGRRSSSVPGTEPSTTLPRTDLNRSSDRPLPPIVGPGSPSAPNLLGGRP